ncbi:MAG: hypothetical protein MRZ66_07145 [Clostridiales bacterium]|nr:hypothetical protein [Clostridiales bacterium]
MKSKYCKVVSMLLTVVLVLGALVYATPESPQETSENSSMIGETDENSMENEPLPNETSVFSEINEQADLSEESSDSLSDETDDSEIPTSAPSAETYEENESITSNQGTRPVEITVLSRNGDIIENASVSINGEQRTVDSDGVVFFDSVPFGYVEVSVSADGYSSLRTTIGVPENSTDVYNKSVIMTSVVYDDIINSADLYSIQEDTPSALSLDDEEVLESAAANSNDEIYTTYTSAFYGNYGEVSFNTVSGDCIAYNESIYIIDANATVQYRMWDGEWAIHPKCPGGNNGCAAEVNGKIYFFATLMDAEYYDYVYVFDTDTNTWSDTNCDVPLGVFSANVVNGKIYCFNGEVMYIFDPATNEIASIQNSGPSIPMTKCSSIVYKNEIHFTGMVNDEPEEANAVMIYDTVKNEWSGGNARPNYSIHGCGGGTFLNLGGYCIYQGGASADDPDDGVTYETTPYIYMPGLSEWHTFDTNVNINIGGTKERWEWASACAYNNKVYFVCESPTESGHSAFAVTHFAEVAASHKRAASGARHMVYIDNDNKVRTIGDNSYGQLGNGTNTSSTEFTETAMQWNTDITNFPRKVAAGNATTYLLTTNNELYAWGDNSCGQFGNGTKISSNVPVKIMDDVVDVEAGAKHAIIQKSNGNIYTFGDNTYGQLGVGDTDEYIGAVYIGDMASRIEAGDYQSYYITKYGQTLYGCGKNNNGQLGIGDTTNRSEFVLVLDDVASVSCGKDHSIALKSNGDVCVWGNNTFGQLGVELNEGAAYTVNPVMLPVVNASNVYAGANSSAYTVGGVLYQCGEGMPNPNSFSQITNISSETFGDMDGCIALGNYCIAVDSAGKPWQWGMMTETDDIFGKSYTYIPQKVNYGFDIELIDSYRTQTLAVDSGGSLLAWGTGYFADGTDKEATHTYPKIISGVENIVQVSRGKNHNLVLDQDGDVWGWGSNSNAPMGALGGKVKTVTKLSGISDVKQLSAGTEFSIFLKNDGTLWGVGKNNTGQLGQGNTTNSSAPVQITDKDDFISVDTGEDFVAALASDGLYVWGGNSYGQLGTGGIDAELTPYKLNISLQDGEEISCIKTGPDYCLMLTSSGNVYSWGRNTMGQLGLGNKTNQTLPTKIASLQNIKYISTGYNQSFAVKEDGKVYGFGGGNNGQLGIANTGSNQTPVQISNLTNINAVKIVGGNGYSIAVDEYGYMYSFGTKEGGVLGLYSTSADTFDNQAKKEREWLNQYMEQYGYEITEDLSLPMISNNGYSITWESSDESHLSSTGSVMKPDIFSEDASVILTARIWYGDKYVTAKFEYLINKVEDTLLTADIPERVKNNVMNTNEENINTNIIINDEDSDENEEENSISLMSAHVHSDSFREINQTKNILLNKSMSVFNNRISAGDKVTTILESPDNCFYSVGLQGSAYTLKGMGNTDNFFYNSKYSSIKYGS